MSHRRIFVYFIMRYFELCSSPICLQRINLMNLLEATTFMRENPSLEVLSQSTELKEFLDEIQDAGRIILLDVEREELIGLISLVQSAICASLIDDNEQILASLLMTKMDVFRDIVVIALKYSVGITVTEDWR